MMNVMKDLLKFIMLERTVEIISLSLIRLVLYKQLFAWKFLSCQVLFPRFYNSFLTFVQDCAKSISGIQKD